MKYIILVAAFLQLLGGCAKSVAPVDESSDKTIEEMRAEALAEIDIAACVAGGGEVRQAGMMGMPRCITPYADAGEICRGSSDCEGRCMGSDDITDYDAPSGEAQGRCEADDSPFGCYATIEDGVPDAMLCVD